MTHAHGQCINPHLPRSTSTNFGLWHVRKYHKIATPPFYAFTLSLLRPWAESPPELDGFPSAAAQTAARRSTYREAFPQILLQVLFAHNAKSYDLPVLVSIVISATMVLSKGAMSFIQGSFRGRYLSEMGRSSPGPQIEMGSI